MGNGNTLPNTPHKTWPSELHITENFATHNGY